MKNGFVEIDSQERLEQFLTESSSAAVLFKHSNMCGVSSRAYDEMAKLNEPVGLITVQKARAVSDEIEKRWNVAGRLPLSTGSFNKSLDLHGSTIMIGKNPKSKLYGHFWRESTGAGATTGK